MAAAGFDRLCVDFYCSSSRNSPRPPHSLTHTCTHTHTHTLCLSSLFLFQGSHQWPGAVYCWRASTYCRLKRLAHAPTYPWRVSSAGRAAAGASAALTLPSLVKGCSRLTLTSRVSSGFLLSFRCYLVDGWRTTRQHYEAVVRTNSHSSSSSSPRRAITAATTMTVPVLLLSLLGKHSRGTLRAVLSGPPRWDLSSVRKGRLRGAAAALARVSCRAPSDLSW